MEKKISLNLIINEAPVLPTLDVKGMYNGAAYLQALGIYSQSIGSCVPNPGR
jgi:hypothetical protein